MCITDEFAFSVGQTLNVIYLQSIGIYSNTYKYSHEKYTRTTDFEIPTASFIN